MKRHSSLVLLACWLVLLYVISTITFAAIESVESDSEVYSSTQNSPITENQGLDTQ